MEKYVKKLMVIMYFYPINNGGCWDSSILRLISNVLDNENLEWNKIVKKSLNEKENKKSRIKSKK